MNQTENINDLVSSLAKAQGEMRPALKNETSHYKKKYADFNAVMEVCREPLSKNGLAVMQYAEGDSNSMKLVTMLAHSSGQWIKSSLPLIMAKNDCQGFGSAMTYMKRYGLAALLGIVCDEDDDGEAAVGRGKQKEVDPIPEKAVEKLSFNEIKDITTILGEDTERLNKILAHYKVDSLANIPRSNYGYIMKALMEGQNNGINR